MWLAQFVCAPQFFKTPKGLRGHTVYRREERHYEDVVMIWVAEVVECFKHYP
jgi:hypothetical protein